MSIDTTAASPAHLTSTSYLVLGLIEREGPSTPYELKRHVAATIGHFWSFPHALLYKEPPRLVGLGLLTEERESDGRRRRLFTITGRGRAAIRAWLAKPSEESTELRDAGLLQLFFADLGSTEDRRDLAVAQLAIHRAALAHYEDDRRAEGMLNGSDSAARTVEHWRGVTLPMGVLYEQAAVEFWEGVAAGARVDGAAADSSRAEDDGARLAPNEAWRDGSAEASGPTP
jgi:PadR family transcriptional regulator AphA